MTSDFTRIRGISPKIASRLQEVGILTFEKLAAMTPNEVVARIGIASGVSSEAIAKKDWIGQAAKLAEQPEPVESGSIKTEPELHAVNYLVELFLDDQNQVRRTRIHHVESDEENAWEGWQEQELITFFTRRAELSIPKQTTPKPIEQPTNQPEMVAVSLKKSVKGSASPTVISSMTKTAAQKAQPDMGTTGEVGAIGQLRLQGLELVPADLNSPSRSFSHNQDFNIRLNLNMTEIADIGNELFNYDVRIRAKSLTGEEHQSITQEQGVIAQADETTLNLKGKLLPPGVYRMSASLTLSPQNAKIASGRNLTTSLDGGLFEVF